MGSDHWITAAFVFGSVFCLAFGNSLQPLSSLVLLQPLLALISYDRLILLPPAAWAARRSRIWHFLACMGLIVAHAVGGTVAFGGTFGS